MAKYAVIRTGGKQYLVRENEELLVERLDNKVDDKIELETLGVFDDENDKTLEIGAPLLSTMIGAQIMEHSRGDKIRVFKFKSKVRYRKAMGFRADLTKIKILAI
jgi:large subunit ribosomal protein L21